MHALAFPQRTLASAIAEALAPARAAQVRSGSLGGRCLVCGGATKIAAGAPLLAEGQVEELLPVPELLTASGENFLLRIRGESMIEDGIHNGDYVVVRRQDTADDGEIIAALVDGGEATVKRIYRESDRIRLQPANSSMAPIYADDVVVLGRIVGVFRRIP